MGLIRFALHFLSLLLLVAAIGCGVFDSIQSVSASAPVFTSLGNAWLNIDPEGLTLAEMSADDYIGAEIWRPFIAPLLAQPAFAVFLVLSLIFWIVGYSRPTAPERFSA